MVENFRSSTKESYCLFKNLFNCRFFKYLEFYVIKNKILHFKLSFYFKQLINFAKQFTECFENSG